MTNMQKYMYGRVFSLAWPAIMEGFGLMLAGVFSTAMVGQFGAVSVGGVGLAMLLQGALAMILGAAGTGAAAIVAREWGGGNLPEVGRVAGQAVLLALCCGVLIAVVGHTWAPGIFVLIGADPAVAALAGDLARIMFCFIPFQLVMVVGNAILRGLGLTRQVFYLSTSVSIISLSVGYVLIFGVGVPQLQAYGAAYGVGVSQVFGGIGILFLLFHTPSLIFRWQDVFVYRGQVIRRILAVSIPAAMEQVALQGGRIAFTFMLAGIGATQFAAHHIALQVESISFMPGFGLAIAAMALVGQNLGKGLPHRAAQYTWFANRIGFVGMTGVGVLFVLGGEFLASLFIKDPEVIYWGGLCVMIAALEQPPLAVSMILGGALRGAGDTKWPMYITFIGVWVIRMPLIYLFIVHWKCNVTIAWYITALDFAIRAVIMWWRVRSNQWLQKTV